MPPPPRFVHETRLAWLLAECRDTAEEGAKLIFGAAAFGATLYAAIAWSIGMGLTP